MPMGFQMAMVAARVPRERSIRVKPAWVVAVSAFAAAGVYMAMRVPTAYEMQRALATICTNLEMRPGDWPCEVTAGSTLAAFLPSSLLVGLGLALPCAVLVATGRRIAALAPLLVPAGYVAGVAIMIEVFVQSATPDRSVLGIFESVFSYGDVHDTYWSSRPILAAMVDTACIAVPVLGAALFAWRSDRSSNLSRKRPAVGAASAWLSIAVVATAVVLLTMFWNRFGNAAEISAFFSTDGAWITTLVVVSFGVLLGPDRRFSPWIFAPVALLLSVAVPIAIMGSLVHSPTAYGFGAVAPLVTMGLAGSAWRPLAEAFGRARARRPSDEHDQAETELPRAPAANSDRPRVRRIVIANALAGGLVAVSLIAARFDPLPVQISTSLPTYLGLRNLVADVSVRTELRDGLAAIDAHYADHGTYRGFDVQQAPRVSWLEGSLADPERTFGSENTGLEVVLADDNSAELVGLSSSGRVICARAEHAEGGSSVMTWGVSADIGSIASRLSRATQACGDRPLDTTALRTFPIDELCPDVDASDVVGCRSMQRYLRGLSRGFSTI